MLLMGIFDIDIYIFRKTSTFLIGNLELIIDIYNDIWSVSLELNFSLKQNFVSSG